MIRGGVSYFESQAKINMWLCGCVYSTCGKSFYAGILSHHQKKKKAERKKTLMEAFSVRTMTQSPTFIVIYQLSTQTQLHDSTVENSARLYLP